MNDTTVGRGETAPHIHIVDLRFTRFFALICTGAIEGAR
jgi:hypothetical protein